MRLIRIQVHLKLTIPVPVCGDLEEVAAQLIENGGDRRSKIIRSSQDWWNFERCALSDAKTALFRKGFFV